jgi:hypothetical protein
MISTYFTVLMHGDACQRPRIHSKVILRDAAAVLAQSGFSQAGYQSRCCQVIVAQIHPESGIGAWAHVAPSGGDCGVVCNTAADVLDVVDGFVEQEGYVAVVEAVDHGAAFANAGDQAQIT